ncbi:MAG: ABC transporter permease [Lentisphaerae bacterium]|nr:ABC transporter permease [Lentisphaerota bacterium]
MNPLYWLDLRVRVRERRLWIMPLFFLLIPLLQVVLAMLGAYTTEVIQPGEVGTTVAMFAIFTQAGLLILLSPLASAQRISQEREQRTYAALANSTMTPSALARGKLLGAWTFTLWLSALTLPFVLGAALWGGLELWVYLACFALNVLVGLTLSTLALGLSGLFGRSLSAYLAAGAVLFLWCFAFPMFGGLTFGLLSSSVTKSLVVNQVIMGGFFFHHPVAPQIWMVMRGSGVPSVFQDWGGWVPALGVGVWLLLNLLGYALAVRGLRREVY